GSTQIVGGQIVYTPNDDFEGVDTFQYTITDEDGETSIATVTVTVNDEGAPVAVDDSATTDEEQSVTIDVTQNDSMIDGATLTSATQGSHGSTQIVGGQIVYTPNDDFEGVDTFQYTITDEDGETSIATVTVNVNPLNDPPIISQGEFATVNEANLADGTQPNSSLLTDTAGNYISISDVDGGDGYWINEIAVVNPDGTLTGNTVTTDIGTLVFTSFDGSQLNYTYLLNDNLELDATHYDDSVIVRTDDGSTGGVVIKVAQITDDAPLNFDTDSVVIQSDGLSSDSDALNFAIADGADGLGSVTFKTDINGSLFDAPELYFDSGNGIEQIDWVLSENSTVVTGVVDGNEVITVTLNGGLDSYSAVSNADGTFLAPGETLPTVNSALTTANSKDYSGAINIGGSNVDIVVSGSGNINTTTQDIGIGNQWINSGDEAIISFYTNSTLSGSSDTLTFDGTPESVPIVNFELVVYQDSGDGGDFDVYVIDSSGAESLYDSYQNILASDSISISSSNVTTDIVGVKIVGTGDKFSIQAGDLDYLNPSDLSFDMSIVGTDTDNDSVDSSITIGIDQDGVDGVVVNGQIIDGFVGGLAYETSSGITGFTSSNGSFNYQVGDTITFSIGNVILASIAADALTDAMNDGKLFLQEIAGVEQTNLNDEYVENMAVLLQTLDSNADAQDGIQISEEMHEAFSDDNFDLTSISGQELQTILIDNGLTPVSEEDAMAHVQDMLEDLANIDSSEFEEHIVDVEPLVDLDEDLDLSNVIMTEVVTETVVHIESTDENVAIPVEDLIYEQESGEFSDEGTGSETKVALDTGMSSDTPVANDSVQQLIDDELETEYSDG
ncbi:MAG: tandem-95 repeat protein, partial [Pseudomonadota bacterium]|nr:tandem-95 repeat protein [Pseudomonadota bacterium]